MGLEFIEELSVIAPKRTDIKASPEGVDEDYYTPTSEEHKIKYWVGQLAPRKKEPSKRRFDPSNPNFKRVKRNLTPIFCAKHP
ncbi:hypothetical protein MRB53_013208 [Persea americana]|uniref:Uncharacterized protein n=1 Tax=Persea americana TaxID=3435 RepID=A0ACC2K7E3_PERAE|nr:hypothetical protein MRB53_013208 [Persea americana]